MSRKITAATEPPTPSSLPAASLQIHEELWHARKDLREALAWTKFASIWLISLGALSVAALIVRSSTLPGAIVDAIGLSDLILGGLLFVGTSPVVLFRSIRAQRRVEEWIDSTLPFLYRVKFELLPHSGPDRAHDIWERYKSIYRDLAPADSPGFSARIGRRLGNTLLKFGSEIRGKTSRHLFTVYATVGTDRGLFVRRFESDAPVGRADLEAFKAEVEDRLKRAKEGSCVVGAFSRAGFSNEAVAFVQGEKALVDGDYPIDLIRETESGYEIVWVESD